LRPIISEFDAAEAASFPGWKMLLSALRLAGGTLMNGSEKPELKSRFDEDSMSPEQDSAIRILANELHRVNEAVMNCVSHGLSIELKRVKRFHSEEGYWGDMIVPIIVKQSGQQG
jgi:hypothetical protein